MRRAFLLLLLAACGPKGSIEKPEPEGSGGASPTPVDAQDAGPDQAGEISMEEVKVEMEAVRDEIKVNCASTTAFAGVTKVIVTIRPDGTASAEVESSSGMPEVDKCVLDSIAGSQFSQSARGQRFHYSFKFK